MLGRGIRGSEEANSVECGVGFGSANTKKLRTIEKEERV